MTTGLLGGGLLDAAIHGNRDATNRTLLASALDSPSQLDALQALDLRTELKLTPGTTIITHSQPVDRHTMNSVKTRRGESPSKCYSELIVADVFYQKAAIYGRSLRTLFMVRDFGAGEKIAFEYKAWGGNGLKLFPPKEGEDAVAALDELVAVFKKNFQEYANNERRRHARRPNLTGSGPHSAGGTLPQLLLQQFVDQLRLALPASPSSSGPRRSRTALPCRPYCSTLSALLARILATAASIAPVSLVCFRPRARRWRRRRRSPASFRAPAWRSSPRSCHCRPAPAARPRLRGLTGVFKALPSLLSAPKNSRAASWPPAWPRRRACCLAALGQQRLEPARGVDVGGQHAGVVGVRPSTVS
jgi:hypothetical protein